MRRLVPMLAVALLTGCATVPEKTPTPQPWPAGAPPVVASPAGTTPPSPGLAPLPVEPPAAPSGAATVTVHDADELESALATARPGDIIELAAGTYLHGKGKRWIAAADGTADDPITLRGTREAVLVNDSPRGDYGLSITGDHWVIQGLSVSTASKGIVLDGSEGTLLTGVDVGSIGAEGIHFRACSTGWLVDSVVHDTGLDKPQYGEGVYVGSANGNWHDYGCANGEDHSWAVVQGTTIRDTTAEGADIKEGTTGGVLRGNTFVATGTSGQNSADSAIDLKGNGWVVTGNTIGEPVGADMDAIQVHAVLDGWGGGNAITGNAIAGAWPGFGVGLYPAGDNRVACDNSAPAAIRGLVGEQGRPRACSA